MMDEKGLLNLKDQIAEAKTKKAELTGKLELHTQQLKDDWGCKNITAAEEKVKSLDDEIAVIKGQIATGLKKLEGQL